MKKKYFRVEYTGSMPTIRGHRFHPWLFHGTQNEMDDILEDHLSGREDEFKIMAVHSFDTLEEFNKYFPAIGQGEPLPKEELTPMELFAKQKLEIEDRILRDTARNKNCDFYKELLTKERYIISDEGTFSNLRGQIK